jgi:hypothetical protein
MLGRKFLLLVAVLMGLTALAASVAPRDPALRSAPERRPTATPAPQATEPPAASPETGTVDRVISADAARPERIVVKEGEVVELEVSSSEVGSVSLMDRIQAVDPDSNARFNIYADRVGSFNVTLGDADRVVGVLEVEPAT